VRRLDQRRAILISGTEGARNPFFSPDGQWIAFFSGGKLKKVSVLGGGVVTLCDSPANWGGTWMEDESIIFSPTNSSALWRVSSAGGSAEPLTRFNSGEAAHRWPQAATGGQTILFSAGSGGSWDNGNLVALSVNTGETKIVWRGGYRPQYVSPGYLTYVHERTLFAVPFSLDRLEVTGQPVPIVEDVMATEAAGVAQLALSENGSLIYVSGTSVDLRSSLVWVDRAGKEQALPMRLGNYANPRLSPDGRMVAVSDLGPGRQDIWTYDLARETLTRLTFEGLSNTYPWWSTDGKRVIYRSQREGQPNLFWKAADGSGLEERLTSSEYQQAALSVSPDANSCVHAAKSDDEFRFAFYSSGWRPETTSGSCDALPRSHRTVLSGWTLASLYFRRIRTI
jgi:serine/threonine-protein kinase